MTVPELYFQKIEGHGNMKIFTSGTRGILIEGRLHLKNKYAFLNIDGQAFQLCMEVHPPVIMAFLRQQQKLIQAFLLKKAPWLGIL